MSRRLSLIISNTFAAATVIFEIVQNRTIFRNRRISYKSIFLGPQDKGLAGEAICSGPDASG